MSTSDRLAILATWLKPLMYGRIYSTSFGYNIQQKHKQSRHLLDCEIPAGVNVLLGADVYRHMMAVDNWR